MMTDGSKVALLILGAALGALVLIAGCVALPFLLFRHGRLSVNAAAQPEHSYERFFIQEKRSAPQGDEFSVSADPGPADAQPSDARRKEAIARGVAYLLAAQADDGSWGERNVGITALCAQALLAGGKTTGNPPVCRAVEYLLKHQKEDGGIYGVGLKNYTTSIALMVLVKTDPKAYADAIEKAKAYLIERQWDEAESIDRNHAWYGGAGYGNQERPDLSNTSYFLEALRAANVPKEHPVWAKAVVFVSRAQARSESNDNLFVGTDDGGFIYTPHEGGESKAGYVDLPDGKKGLKSYGGMTYAGFKSFIHANLKRDDPRVGAALEWIRRHWTFEENPELGRQGLYYYYQTAAKALAAWGEDTITDLRQRPHDWRAELTDALLRRQGQDGSWVNEADRWYEGYPPVPTSYAIIALSECE